jgi:hypothetical protein
MEQRAVSIGPLQPSVLERVEGAAVALIGLYLYTRLGYNWVLFAVLILAPDLSMVGYLANPRTGAAVYNLFHIYLWPAALLAIGLVTDNGTLNAIALTWMIHIGIDRMSGFGLKYPTFFKDTHLQHL